MTGWSLWQVKLRFAMPRRNRSFREHRASAESEITAT